MKTNAKQLLLLAIILGCSFFVFANEQKESALTTNSLLTASEEVDRWAEESKKADNEMNRVYQKLLSTRSAKGQEALRKAQRAWIKFRDVEAESVKQDWEGGSGQAGAVTSALAVLTRNRIRELEELYNN